MSPCQYVERPHFLHYIGRMYLAGIYLHPALPSFWWLVLSWMDLFKAFSVLVFWDSNSNHVFAH